MSSIKTTRAAERNLPDLRGIVNRFWKATAVIMGKNHTVRLSGGTETGRTMQKEKVWLRFKMLKSPTSLSRGNNPASSHHLGVSDYNPRYSEKQIIRAQKVEENRTSVYDTSKKISCREQSEPSG